MNRDFEFKQILRAYRAGIIHETAFEQEMQSLENGSANSQEGFKAFGRSYASEREAVLRFLETVSAAETNGGEAIRKWLEVCTTECIRGGLKMVAEREAYHGRAFERRLNELGGNMPDRQTRNCTRTSRTWAIPASRTIRSCTGARPGFQTPTRRSDRSSSLPPS